MKPFHVFMTTSWSNLEQRLLCTLVCGVVGIAVALFAGRILNDVMPGTKCEYIADVSVEVVLP